MEALMPNKVGLSICFASECDKLAIDPKSGVCFWPVPA
jgi:hypothetical protein